MELKTSVHFRKVPKFNLNKKSNSKDDNVPDSIKIPLQETSEELFARMNEDYDLAEEEETPGTRNRKQLESQKQKAETKQQMISHFKEFIYSQQAKNLQTSSAAMQQTQDELQINVALHRDRSIESALIESPKNNKGLSNIVSSPMLKRSNSIAQAIQKRLRIVHKTKDQIFNEKLKMFKGISTYIETKPFLENLNLLNQRELVENLQRTQEIMEKVAQVQERSQFSLEPQPIKQQKSSKFKLLNTQQDFVKMAASITTNPSIGENKKTSVLEKSNNFLQKGVQKLTKTNKNDPQFQENQEVSGHTFFRVMNGQELSDEELFYSCLYSELEKEGKIPSVQTQVDETTDFQRNQSNLIYQSTDFLNSLSPEQIQLLLVNKTNENLSSEDNNVNSISRIIVDQNTSLKAKDQYKEFVERATQIRGTLHRLNEQFFKHKWANAQMKQKKEKEKMKKEVMSKLANEDVKKSKVDLLFPASKKMPHIKSRVDTNLNFDGFFQAPQIIPQLPQVQSPNYQSQRTLQLQKPFTNISTHRSVHTLEGNSQLQKRNSLSFSSKLNEASSKNYRIPSLKSEENKKSFRGSIFKSNQEMNDVKIDESATHRDQGLSYDKLGKLLQDIDYSRQMSKKENQILKKKLINLKENQQEEMMNLKGPRMESLSSVLDIDFLGISNKIPYTLGSLVKTNNYRSE